VEHFEQLFIDGQWVAPTGEGTRCLIDPTSEEPWATVTAGGGVGDVDRAVAAAKRAFVSFSRTSVAERRLEPARVTASGCFGSFVELLDFSSRCARWQRRSQIVKRKS
jgi:aldehyde dehydrogenase (NAD+)